MPTEQAGNGQPDVDTTYDDAKAAFDEVTRGPASEPEPVAPAEPVAEPAPTEAKPEDDRPRDELGRFVKEPAEDEKPAEAKPEKVAAPVEPPKPEIVQKLEVAAQAQAGPIPSAPPPGWSVKSKSEWDKLPEHIRADIVKREQEVNSGFAEYAGMKPLKRYVDMARQSGTTLDAALDRYIGIETLLRQDPFRALTTIAQNVGLTPQALVTGLQLHLGVGPSNGHAQVPQGEGQSSGQLPPEVLQQYFNPLAQEVTQLKQLLTQQQQADEARMQGALNSTLARFQADPAHRYYENVRAQMGQLIKGGVVPSTGDDMADLQSAYELACWQDPEIRALMINEQTAKSQAEHKQKEKDAAEKARQASRSITGSPSSTVKDSDGRSGDGSPEDDARAAYHAVMNSTRV